jgi:hypothetical protein
MCIFYWPSANFSGALAPELFTLNPTALGIQQSELLLTEHKKSETFYELAAFCYDCVGDFGRAEH